MRTPQTPEQMLDWHARSVAGERVSVDADEPQAGWFRRRLVRFGPWVPVRIWWEQDIDPETGELVSPEVLRAEENGVPCDPYRVWMWACSNPITERQFRLLERERSTGKQQTPTEKVDLRAIGPIFPPEPATGDLFDG